MSITSFSRCGICFAIILSLISLGSLPPAILGYDDSLGICPPYGTRMPPAEFKVFDGPGKWEMEEFPADCDAYRHEKAEWSAISLGMSKRQHANGEPTDFDWEWLWNIEDRHLLMVGGQIYRCDTTAMRFSRIPDHELQIAPKDSLRLFAIPTTAGLNFSFRRPDTTRIYKIGMTTVEFDSEQQTLNEPGKARLKLTLGSDHHLLAPHTSAVDDTAWVRAGQYIETTRWLLHVTRIVFPDSKQGIEGWVEVRVEQTRTPMNRPPAPSLPESPAAQLPETSSEPIRLPADRPPAPRLWFDSSKTFKEYVQNGGEYPAH